MKLGLLTSILQDRSFEEIVDFASQQGFSCLEVACWPKGSADRRYAGAAHLNVEDLTEQEAMRIKEKCLEKQISISALAYYPNTMDENKKNREQNIIHLKKVIAASKMLDVNMVTTFIGRVENKTIEENLEEFQGVWRPLIKYAEENGVKIAVENCPMLFGKEQWPGGQNLFSTPSIWRKVFELLPSDNLGINYDPSHFVWQMMDYIAPIYEFKDKIFHVHIKDIKVSQSKLKDVGTMAYPLSYMQPKIPGYGDVNWGKYISALSDIGFNGPVCIEIEDKAFENSGKDIERAIVLSKRYISQFII